MTEADLKDLLLKWAKKGLEKTKAFFLIVWKGIKIFLLAIYKPVLLLLVLVTVPLLVRNIILQAPFEKVVTLQADQDKIDKTKKTITKETAKIDKKLASKVPRSYYLVINSSSNEFVLYKGNTPLKKDKCSTGSYVLLKAGDQQQWMFKTPKGEFRIHGKTTSPVWKKPDWAFVEEGMPVPSANHHTRFEYGVLGDYALSLGQGYLIHGTLYQRFLGLPVTHGCIRLNDENLKLIYNSMSVGSKVYIY